MLPDLAARITGSTACIALSAPKTFTAIIFSRSSGRIVSTVSAISRPAELIRISTLPKASFTCSIAQNTRARSVTSQSSASALPPALLIFVASSSSCTRRRASSATCAPCSPNASATSCPIPLDAPVTTTDLSKKYPRTGPFDSRLASLIAVTSLGRRCTKLMVWRRAWDCAPSSAHAQTLAGPVARQMRGG